MFYFYAALGLVAAAIYRYLPHAQPDVVAHLPSRLFLPLAAFSPALPVVPGLLLVFRALAQMAVPTRRSCVPAVVPPPETPAAASVTAVPRSLASSLSPALAGALLASSFTGLPLVVCGMLKIVYDLVLLFSFRHTKPPEELAAKTTPLSSRSSLHRLQNH